MPKKQIKKVIKKNIPKNIENKEEKEKDDIQLAKDKFDKIKEELETKMITIFFFI